MKKTILYTFAGLLSLQAQAGPATAAFAKSSRAELEQLIAPHYARNIKKVEALSTGKLYMAAYTSNKGKTGQVEVISYVKGGKKTQDGLARTSHPISEMSATPDSIFIDNHSHFLTVDRTFKNPGSQSNIREHYLEPLNGYPQLDMYRHDRFSSETVDGITLRQTETKTLMRTYDGISIKFERNGATNLGRLKIPASEGQVIGFNVNAAGDRLSVTRLNGNQAEVMTYSLDVDRKIYQDTVKVNQIGREILTPAAMEKLAVKTENFAVELKITKKEGVKGMDVEGVR